MRSVGSLLARTATLALALVLLLGACAPSWEESPPTVPLAWFYRPAADASAERVARVSQRYILTQLDEPFRDELVAAGARGPFLQYLRFEAIMDDTDLGFRWHNQVAYQEGDFARLSREHPDWFLLDESGQRMRAGDGDDAETRFWLMDPASPGWRAFFLERLRAMQDRGGWDGVFLDNVELSLGKRERTGQLPAAYPTDEAWASAHADFLRFLREQWADPEGRPMEANVIEARRSDPPEYRRVLADLDGVMREGWLDGEDADWEGRMREAERAQDLGLQVWLPANGDQDDDRERRYALASFLLADRGRASFRYTSFVTYDELWLHEDLRHGLGAPVGDRYREGDVWVRDFEGGRVEVDPRARTGRVLD